MKDSGKDVKKALLILHRGGVCLGSCLGRRPSILEKSGRDRRGGGRNRLENDVFSKRFDEVVERSVNTIDRI